MSEKLWRADWSGVICYETKVEVDNPEDCSVICVEDAFEALELWVNGNYAGERIAPPYRFDVRGLCKPGLNEIRFECRTTLECMVHGITHGVGFFGPEFAAVAPSGIVGKVTLC